MVPQLVRDLLAALTPGSAYFALREGPKSSVSGLSTRRRVKMATLLHNLWRATHLWSGSCSDVLQTKCDLLSDFQRELQNNEANLAAAGNGSSEIMNFEPL